VSRRDAFAALAWLQTAYARDMPAEQATIYLDALADIDPDGLAAALPLLAKTERWFPTIAAIMEASAPVGRSPEEAWGTVLARIRQLGRMGGAAGLDPDVRAAVDACGGWVAICESSNPTGDRITFVKAYSAIAQRAARTPQTGNQPLALTEALRQIGNLHDQ
jgi:hypothetical protein